MNGHANITDAPVHSLLRRFLQLQETRVALSNELTSAFDEPHITDAALDRVIQISSLGLLEVKNEVSEIQAELEQRTDETREEVFCIKEVERVESRRLEELIKGLQLKRVATLKSGELDADEKRDMERAVQESNTK